jgi:DNA-binding response OmpR family regulator
MPHIIIIDDDELYLKMLKTSLRREGYSITTSQFGEKILSALSKMQPDLILLDVMLQNESGILLTKKIRQFSSVPIIIISGAKTAETDVVKGLDNGADDYLFKPYSLSELLARIRAVLRRSQPEMTAEIKKSLTNGKLKINFAKAEVWKENVLIPLSSTEYRLLLVLAQNMGEVVPTNQLLTAVWGENYQDEKEILWVTIARLRQKVEDNTRSPKFIVTKTGMGYMMPNLNKKSLS